MSVEKAIWSAYLDNPCRLFSIRELALHLKKSYSLIHQHVSRLLSQQKLHSKTIGKSILCYPNFNNSYTLLALALAEQKQTKDLALEDASLKLLHQYFYSQSFPGLLSVWKSEKELVIFLADSSCQKSVEFSLSKTTLLVPIKYISYSNKEELVDFLIKKSVVIFGFEQFQLLIRHSYEAYASKHNLVKLHE